MGRVSGERDLRRGGCAGEGRGEICKGYVGGERGRLKR